MKKIILSNKLSFMIDGSVIDFKPSRYYILPEPLANSIFAEPGVKQYVSAEEFVNKKIPPDSPDYNNKSLLVARTGGRGDFFFILRSIKEIKDNFKNVKVVFACSGRYKAMLKAFFPKLIDTVIALPFIYDYYANCDYFFTFEDYIEGNKDACVTNAYDMMAVKFKIGLPGSHHIDIEIPWNVETRAKEISDKWPNKPIIGIQPKASAILRTYPFNYLAELIKMFKDDGFEILLLDGKENVDIIRGFIPDTEFLVPYDEKGGSFEISVALAKYCKIIICPDSVFTYIGDSLGIPTLALFGPFGSFLRADRLNVYAIENKEGCYNCCTHSNSPCKMSTDTWSPCLKSLQPVLVHEVSRRILDGGF